MVTRTPQEHIETRGSSISDTLTPTDHDGNAVDLADSIDYICSQLADILGESAWETAPDASIATIDARTFLEDKLALKEIQLLTSITVPSAVKATGSIDCDDTGTDVIPADGETVVIDDGINAAVTFEFDTNSSVTQTDTLRQVDISSAADDDDVRDALITAITNAPTLDITASSGGAGIVSLSNDVYGTVGNVTITDTVTDAKFAVSGMSGGAGDMKILSVASSEVPGGGNNIKAVGAGTVQGLLCTTNASFGTWTADEISGDNAVYPKNLLAVYSTASGEAGDPVMTADGQRIWGLLQSETGATDNSAFTDVTPERAQVSFVCQNAAGNDLVHVDGDDIGGQAIRLTFIDREDLDSWTEQDFLHRSAFVDIGSGAAAGVNLNNVIDNQSTTPATQATDVYWRIDDDDTLNFQDSTGAVDMLSLKPAAAGDEVEINADTVDINVGAAGVINMDNGASVDTGGQTINLGTTAGQVDSTTMKVAATSGLAEVEGTGVTIDGSAGAGGAITIDGTTLDADFTSGDGHLIQSVDDVSDKDLLIASRNAGAGEGGLKLEADDHITFETGVETGGITLDESGKQISTLFSQSFSSIAAAIEYAGTTAGVSFETVKYYQLASNVAATVNMAGATLDLTEYTLDWPTTGNTSTAARVLVFYQGSLLRAGSGLDIETGTTEGDGDLKHNFPKPFLSGHWLFSVGFK